MKQVSPFIALAFFLSIFLPVSLISGNVLFNSVWLTVFALSAAIVYLVFFDIILKKYFRGKSFGRLYVMEIISSVFVLYLLVFQSVDPGNHITHLAKMIFH